MEKSFQKVPICRFHGDLGIPWEPFLFFLLRSLEHLNQNLFALSSNHFQKEGRYGR